MTALIVTTLIIWLALNVAFYCGVFASTQDTLEEFYFTLKWTFKHELTGVVFYKTVLLVIAMVISAVFHLTFVRDVLLS